MALTLFLYAFAVTTGTLAAVSFFHVARAAVRRQQILVPLLLGICLSLVTWRTVDAAKITTYTALDPATNDDILYIVDDPGGTPASRKITVNNLAKGITANIAATAIDSGTFADARIAASNVTQHEAAINHDNLTGFVANEHIDWTSDQGATNIDAGNVAGLATSSVTSGTFADARISESSVTQHEAALNMTNMTASGTVQILNDAARLEVKDLSASREIVMRATNNDGFIGTEGADTTLIVGTNGISDYDKALLMTTTGRIGYGDGGPDATFEVSASGGADPIFMLSSDDNNDGDRLIVENDGDVGINETTPDAQLDVHASAAGKVGLIVQMAAAATANPIEVKDSALAVQFAVDDDGGITVGPSGGKLHEIYTGSAVLDFANITGDSSEDLTITVTGAEVGDVVALGIPNGSVGTDLTFMAWVSAADTVTVRCRNNNSMSMEDPASGTFKVIVTDID